MRLRHIEVFHAVYVSESMTKAANLLNVSQPSVSKVLAHAESQVGFPLFERTRGKLVPTPEAHRLFEHVSVVFDSLSRVKRVAANLRHASSGTLRIACTPTLGVSLVPRSIAGFMTIHSDTFFDIETLHMTEITEGLRESRLDVALAFNPRHAPGLSSRPIWHGEFMLIAPRKIAKTLSSPVSLKSLGDLPFIRLNSRGPLGQLLDAYFSDIDTRLNVVAATETYQVARSLVAQDVGVAVVDEITARTESDDTIEILRLEPSLKFTVSALFLDSTPLSLLGQRFLEHLESEFEHYMGS